MTSLAKFGATCEDLLPSVLVLLDRCLVDSDDEVRDRALLYLEVLKQKQKPLSSAYILNRETCLFVCLFVCLFACLFCLLIVVHIHIYIHVRSM